MNKKKKKKKKKIKNSQEVAVLGTKKEHLSSSLWWSKVASSTEGISPLILGTCCNKHETLRVKLKTACLSIILNYPTHKTHMKGYKGKRKVDTCDSSKQVNFFFFEIGLNLWPHHPNLICGGRRCHLVKINKY